MGRILPVNDRLRLRAPRLGHPVHRGLRMSEGRRIFDRKHSVIPFGASVSLGR